MRRFVFAALLGGVMLPTTAFAQQSGGSSEPQAQPQPPPTPSATATPPEPVLPSPTPPGTGPTRLPEPTTGAPAHAPPAARPSRWSGSQLQATVTSNWSTFDRNYTLSGDANAVVDMNISLRPRYRLNRLFQLRARWDYNFEFTNADNTTTEHEPRFGDPSLDLWLTGIPALGDVRFAVAAGFIFPVSPESRSATLIVTPRVIGQVAWGVDAFAGEFGLIGQVGFSHPIYQYTTPGRRVAPANGVQCAGSADVGCALQNSGRTNTENQFSWTAIVVQTWGMWSPGVAFGMTHQWGYDLPTSSLDPGLSTPTGASTSHVRQLTSFSGWLDFSPNPWLTAEVGYYLSRNILDADGTYGNPIYAPYQDWRIYLNANIVIDKFIDALRGTTDAGGGVIRTQNTPRAPLGFRM